MFISWCLWLNGQVWFKSKFSHDKFISQCQISHWSSEPSLSVLPSELLSNSASPPSTADTEQLQLQIVILASDLFYETLWATLVELNVDIILNHYVLWRITLSPIAFVPFQVIQSKVNNMHLELIGLINTSLSKDRRAYWNLCVHYGTIGSDLNFINWCHSLQTHFGQVVITLKCKPLAQYASVHGCEHKMP